MLFNDTRPYSIILLPIQGFSQALAKLELDWRSRVHNLQQPLAPAQASRSLHALRVPSFAPLPIATNHSPSSVLLISPSPPSLPFSSPFLSISVLSPSSHNGLRILARNSQETNCPRTRARSAPPRPTLPCRQHPERRHDSSPWQREDPWGSHWGAEQPERGHDAGAQESQGGTRAVGR